MARDLTVLPAHPHVHPQSEWAIPSCAFPPIVLISRLRRDRRLSGPWYEIAPAEIRTRNLDPITNPNPAVYHTVTRHCESLTVHRVTCAVYAGVRADRGRPGRTRWVRSSRRALRKPSRSSRGWTARSWSARHRAPRSRSAAAAAARVAVSRDIGTTDHPRRDHRPRRPAQPLGALPGADRTSYRPGFNCHKCKYRINTIIYLSVTHRLYMT